jgi:membrane-associated phospholipid phosphatase
LFFAQIRPMTPRSPIFSSWLLVPVGCALFCLVAIAWFDRPLAALVQSYLTGLDGHSFGLARHVINLALDALLVLIGVGIFAIVRFCLDRARAAAPAKSAPVLTLAGISVGGSLAVNELLLKPFFGRYTLDAYFAHPSRYGFAFLHGTTMSSFPSGHAVLVVSFLSVLLTFYPRYRALWLSIIALVLAGLVIAGWHFLSDIAAGVAVGTIGAWMTLRVAAVSRFYSAPAVTPEKDGPTEPHARV